jgi:hypothetical protein
MRTYALNAPSIKRKAIVVEIAAYRSFLFNERRGLRAVLIFMAFA